MTALQQAREVAPSPAPVWLGRAATVALYDELALYPKPGLVSFVDQGSHADMNAATFLRSLFALRHYFPAMVTLGQAGAPFAALQAAGVQAEQAMLRATAGINTHRGAVFSLGLLCAAAGLLSQQHEPPTAAALRDALCAQWGAALRARHTPTSSHGGVAVARHGLRGANEEAALGMPVLFDVAVPVLRARLAAGWDHRRARLDTFFSVMAHLDDTNLVHRGGMVALREAQRAAQAWLQAGGAGDADGEAAAQALHRDFTARRWSPGGSADVLAAACWVVRIEQGAPRR